jgi:TRAP-type C4-dicarboxylate transport system permease small subunit
MRFLGLFYGFVVRALEWLVTAIMGILVVDVVWQVFTRYVLRDPSAWTDELAKMLLIWVALLSAAVGFRRSSHLGVEVLVERLRGRIRTAAEIFIYLTIVVFAVLMMLYGGWRLVSTTLAMGQASPALGVQMGYVYCALPLSGVFVVIFSLENIFKLFKGRGAGATTDREEAPVT